MTMDNGNHETVFDMELENESNGDSPTPNRALRTYTAELTPQNLRMQIGDSPIHCEDDESMEDQEIDADDDEDDNTDVDADANGCWSSDTEDHSGPEVRTPKRLGESPNRQSGFTPGSRGSC